jgi:hypothetical protein
VRAERIARGARIALQAKVQACGATMAAAKLVLVTVLALAGARADAASIETLSTDRDAGRYAVSLRAHLDVPPRAAYAVVADVTNWKRLSPDLRRLEILDQHRDGALELSTAFQACLLWYCRLMYEVPDVFLAPRADGGDIYVMLRPDLGDFHSGQAHWRFRASGSGTELEFSAEVEPAFIVPPLIGPWLMARWLRAEAIQTARNLEALTSSPPQVLFQGGQRSAAADRATRAGDCSLACTRMRSTP